MSLHFAQQADMRLIRCAHFAQMPPPSFYFDGILPIDDRRWWHFAYPQDVIRNHSDMKEVISHHEHCIYLGKPKEKQ